MSGDTDLAALGRLLADQSRATMCTVMLDGRFHTAGELARAAGVAASTASEHLSRLVGGGIVEADRQGRHRYYRLAGSDVAAALEALSVVAPHRPVRDLRSSSAGRALREGRTCYDHLAGRLGVRVTDALVAAGVVTEDYRMGDPSPVLALGVRLPGESRRPVVRSCVDWTERRHHVAGGLPAALVTCLFERGWLTRVGSGRAVRLTGSGQEGLTQGLGVAL